LSAILLIMFKNANRAFLFLILPLFVWAADNSWHHSKIIQYQAKQADSNRVVVGLDLLSQTDFRLIKKKRVAIVCNTGSLNGSGVHILDIIENRNEFELVSIIQISEKRFNTESSGMNFIQSDSMENILHIFITPANPQIMENDLNKANLILFDLQSIGIRFDINYDVLLSLMNLSSKTGIPLLILDRPNPLTATIMEGPTANSKGLQTGVKIPWRYGMTFGELALLINEEGWLASQKYANLYLVPMFHYSRSEWFDETGLPWSIPLNDIYTIGILLKYCSTCFFQYANVSNGLGSLFQYEVGGAPWISGPVVKDRLNQLSEPWVEFSLVTFVPGSRSTVLRSEYYIGEECSGIRINITDRNLYRTSTVGTHLLGIVAQMYSRHFRWEDTQAIDELFGDDSFRTTVDTGAEIRRLYPVWVADLTSFQKIRQKYLLYSNE